MNLNLSLLVTFLSTLFHVTFSKESLTSNTIPNAMDAYLDEGDNSSYGPINEWNTTLVTDISGLCFDYYVTKFNDFNADLSNWDMSNVTDMNYAFYYALNFNGDLSSWDTSKVTDMAGMFVGAVQFNQDLSGWQTGNVKDIFGMFKGAKLFNQDLSSWDITNVSVVSEAFLNSGMNQGICWKVDDKMTVDVFAGSQAYFACSPSTMPSVMPTSLPSSMPSLMPTSMPSMMPIVHEHSGHEHETDTNLEGAGQENAGNGIQVVGGLLLSAFLGWCVL